MNDKYNNTQKIIYKDEDVLKLEDLSHIVNLNLDSTKIEKEIREKFPIENYGDKEDPLKIKKSKFLYDNFFKNKGNKLDIRETLNNVEYMGLSDRNEIILRFKGNNKAKEIVAKGTNNSRRDFLDLFSMAGFGTFCIKNNLKDLLKENIEQLLPQFKNKTVQFRLIERNNKWLIRGITSDKYKNYDNNIVLYLSLLSLNNYALKERINFYVQDMNITDSEMYLSFEQENPIQIDGLGTLYFSILVVNSEIKESAVNFNLRYRIVDKNNKEFMGKPKTLSHSAVSINHSVSVKTAKNRLKDLFRLKEAQEEILENIKYIKNTSQFTREALLEIMEKIVNNTTVFSSDTRTSMSKFYKEIAGNTVALIEALNRVEELSSNIDERIYIQSIIHEVLWKAAKKEKSNVTS